MRKTILFLGLFSVSSILICGCGVKKTEDTAIENDVNVAIDSSEIVSEVMLDEKINDDSNIHITYETITKTYQNEDKTKDILQYTCQLPTVVIDGQDQLTQAFSTSIGNVEAEAEAGAQALIDQYGTDLEDENPNLNYFYDTYFQDKRVDQRIISFQGTFNAFAGGVHSDYWYQGVNLDTQTGEILTLEDICTDKDSMRTAVTSYIKNQLKSPRFQEALMVTDEDELDEVIEESIFTDDTWYFDASGITFISNTYVLASYAEGPWFFSVPYHVLDMLKDEYRYVGPLVLSTPIGSTVSVDLDGDGTDETVYFYCSTDYDTWELKLDFTVNDEDFSSMLQSEQCYLTEGACYITDGSYYIVDLDTSDSSLEIALLDNGFSDDPVTYFFQYKNEDLTLLGNIPELLIDKSCKIKGDGTISTNIPLNILETTTVQGSYELTEEGLVETDIDWYEMNTDSLPEYRWHSILKDVTVHETMDLTSSPIVLSVDDGPVSFTGTDNEHWVELQTEDGKTYYLYMEDFSTVENGDYSTEIFENLLLAG